MEKENLTAILVIRLPKEAISKLKEIAKSKGLNISTLARMWLMEKLQENLRRSKI